MRRPFLAGLVPVVAEVMKDAYPELGAKTSFIQRILTQDEERFLSTLVEGQKRSLAPIASAKEKGLKALPGRERLPSLRYVWFSHRPNQRHGREEGLTVDEESFEEEMSKQRERSRGQRKASTTKWQKSPTFFLTCSLLSSSDTMRTRAKRQFWPW